MSAYGALAAWYDALTRDVDYAAFADFYEQCFQQGRGACRTLLDFLLRHRHAHAPDGRARV